MLSLATSANADVPTLRVTDLGQQTAPVEVGQPPIDIGAMSNCAYPFTIEKESVCPPGTWPALGRQWGLIEDVAGGDTLSLRFTSPVSAVRVGSTSNYEPGLRDPDGRPISNYDVLRESPATATSDPTVWLTTLPPLDARAISTQGYTFSVVAQDESGFHDYPFGIRAPRYANELTYCGMAYYSTGWKQYMCLQEGIPTGRPRRLTLSGATYDGRMLILKAGAPGAGRLKLGIPTRCGNRSGDSCHRRTWIRRRSRHRGKLTIRRALPLRLGARHRMTVAVRFLQSEAITTSTVKLKVRLISDALP